MYNTLESVIESMFLEATVDLVNEEYGFESLQEATLTDTLYKQIKEELKTDLNNIDKYIKTNNIKKLKDLKSNLNLLIKYCDRLENKKSISNKTDKTLYATSLTSSIATAGIGLISIATTTFTAPILALLAILTGTYVTADAIRAGHTTVPKKDIKKAKAMAKSYISKIDKALKK